MEDQQLVEYVNKHGWKLSGPFGNWVNWDDRQIRITKGKNIKYVGATHEQSIGYNKKWDLVGQCIVHVKDRARQERGLQREQNQYELVAKKTYERIVKDE